MEYLVLLFLVFGWCGFGFVADIAGAVYIDKCNLNSPLDIRENAQNTIACKDVGQGETVTWQIKRSGSSVFVTIATCLPPQPQSGCTLHVSGNGQFAAQRSPQESRLVYQQRNRTEDLDATVRCRVEQQPGGASVQRSCWLNVISPAVLSGCVVEDNRDTGTVRGRCYFRQAYNARKALSCTWFWGDSFIILGRLGNVVNREQYTSGGKVYERGQCTLYIQLPGPWNRTRSYTVLFYPGSRVVAAPLGNLGPEISTLSTTTTRRVYASTSTGGEHGSPDTEDDPAPVAAIVSGTIACVVVVAGLVVMAGLVYRRWRRRETEGSITTDAADTAGGNDNWEEYLNPLYGTDPLPTPALHRQQPAPTNAATIYNLNDTIAATRLPAASANRVSKSRKRKGPTRNGTAPGVNTESDLYVVVGKPRKRNDPDRNGTAPASDVYAVVDKSRKRNDPDRNGTAPASDVYAVVDKSRQRNGPIKNGTAPRICSRSVLLLPNQKSSPQPEVTRPRQVMTSTTTN